MLIHAKPCIVAKVGAIRAAYVPSVSSESFSTIKLAKGGDATNIVHVTKPCWGTVLLILLNRSGNDTVCDTCNA